ncbi:SLAM family member 5 isoform X2 [Artibeus jamaicensis]|uniref:SLAM family member 5 isoform X2 n=1 Tax=Artibeus jamaicensis TaxID=9417 RepID=UPI00235A5597|nr:SLAM family member 5 isoform X2 [Artibeus jamaicensis]
MPWKKMAQHYLWIFLLCLQTCLEAVESNTDIITVNGTLGEPVIFPLCIQELQQVTSIAWMNSKTSVALVVVPDSGAAPQVTVTHENYYERINVSHTNYNLEISNLRMEDAGIYKADINVKTSKIKSTITRSYSLQVYRRLGKPKITQSLMTSINSTCNVTLTCSVEKEEKNVIYSWGPLGEEGSVLQIFQTPNNQELIYTCTAWNPVSNNSDSISAQQLCADITVGLHTHHAGLLSGLAVLSLFILILPSVLLFLLCKRRQGPYLKIFNKKADPVSKNTIYTYVMVSRDTQSAESRIYDEIPPFKVLPMKEMPVNTIYSIVQYSDKQSQKRKRENEKKGKIEE